MVMQVWRLYGGVWAFMDVLHRALEGLAWLSPAHRPSTPRHSTPQHAAVASAPPSGGASSLRTVSSSSYTIPASQLCARQIGTLGICNGHMISAIGEVPTH